MLFRTALIGLGRIGWRLHLPAILGHEGYQLCAVVDTARERLDEAASEYGAKGYLDHRAMLEAERPDVVVVASPTLFHEEQAIAALRAGAHVILDKPMTTDLASARRIYDAVKETGGKLIVYQPHRFFDHAMVFKRVLAEGKLGPIYRIKRGNYAYIQRNDWQSFKKYGGGLFMNFGSHFVDQLLHFVNAKGIRRCFGSAKAIATLGDADDVARIFVETDTGVSLDVDISHAAAFKPEELVAYGKYGAAWWERTDDSNCIKIRYYDPAEYQAPEVSAELMAKGRAYPTQQFPWREETYPIQGEEAPDFYAMAGEYFAGRTASPVPLAETMLVMEVMELARAEMNAAEEGEPVIRLRD